MALISVADALAHVTEGLKPLEAESVKLEDARGRVLAEDLAAQLTQPPFDASAMDGFAVRGEDVARLPATLRLIGESAAGSGFAGEIEQGQAVRIFTGAPVPNGADTIVIQENAELDGDTVIIRETEARRHIRPRGQDFKQGDVLLRSSATLGPRELLLAAAMNYADLPVRRRPKVAILSTGDEVVPPGTELGPDQIVSSVAPGLSALVEANGGVAMSLGIAKDTPESLLTLIRAGSAADILVTIGGASVGERDLVRAALKSEGLELVFHKIAMRPGKPLIYGRLGSQRVLGVPGNPVSAMVCGLVFLVPMLQGLLGLKGTGRGLVEAVLAERVEANEPRQHYMRGVSEWTAAGERLVRPLPAQDSSLMADFARADCLIVLAPNAPALAAGERVSILPL
jgi:molybdopterin molybdotransferase